MICLSDFHDRGSQICIVLMSSPYDLLTLKSVSPNPHMKSALGRRGCPPPLCGLPSCSRWGPWWCPRRSPPWWWWLLDYTQTDSPPPRISRVQRSPAPVLTRGDSPCSLLVRGLEPPWSRERSDSECSFAHGECWLDWTLSQNVHWIMESVYMGHLANWRKCRILSKIQESYFPSVDSVMNYLPKLCCICSY